MRGCLFHSKENLILKFKNELNTLAKKDFNKCFDTWIKRCKNIILKNGNYF